MNDSPLETVGDLLAALDSYDPATPLRCATRPGFPMDHHAPARVACTPSDADGTPLVVWLGVGEPVSYLSAAAAEALGWWSR